MRDFLTKKPSMERTQKLNKNLEIAQQLKQDLFKHLNQPSKAQKFKTLQIDTSDEATSNRHSQSVR